jgi:hypothetical protein
MVTLKKAVRVMIWVIGGLGIAFFALVVYRMFVLREKERTMEQVARIHATRLTLDDVMGRNLPPDPGTDADKTIRGIDANHNGIRDDVELAIFREYPGSARIRAAELQYAMALQMELTQVSNSETLVATLNKESSGASCVLDATRDTNDFILVKKRQGEVEKWVFNTPARTQRSEDIFKKYMTSNTLSNESCDIDLTSLQN